MCVCVCACVCVCVCVFVLRVPLELDTLHLGGCDGAKVEGLGLRVPLELDKLHVRGGDGAKVEALHHEVDCVAPLREEVPHLHHTVAIKRKTFITTKCQFVEARLPSVNLSKRDRVAPHLLREEDPHLLAHQSVSSHTTSSSSHTTTKSTVSRPTSTGKKSRT